MKWYVRITIDNGRKMVLPIIVHCYKTKKEAEKVAEQARSVEGIVKAEVFKSNY